jgi:hypothetical protein
MTTEPTQTQISELAREIRDRVDGLKLADANEAATRLKIIDDVIRGVLAWTVADIHPIRKNPIADSRRQALNSEADHRLLVPPTPYFLKPAALHPACRSNANHILWTDLRFRR